ncbi:hypothetical protein [Streptomyces chattanoogensis]|uniref:hypothetical protein n=1 Tax=Streptomyces chattanoogensis TaxID=66876 RepID=UPI000AEFFA2D|nr:hypothetical protein [Streptomyces chattanoogensis]
MAVVDALIGPVINATAGSMPLPVESGFGASSVIPIPASSMCLVGGHGGDGGSPSAAGKLSRRRS